MPGKKRYSWIITLILLLPGFYFSQTVVAQDNKIKQIELHNSDQLAGTRYNGTDIKRLIGNVVLKHEGALMYCDSAYYFQKDNRFIAYSRVRINQGDTLSLFADTIYYYGNGSNGKAINRVKVIDKGTILLTDHIDFNFESDIHRYYQGGKIIDSTNTLISEEGFLFGKEHEYRFLKEVELTTSDYFCRSDTLTYHSDVKTARFFGPTEIFNDTSYLYTELGYYNTQLDFIKLGKKAYYEQSRQSIIADSIFYNKAQSLGKAFNNISLRDDSQQIIIKGNYLYFDEKKEYSYACDSALFIQYEGKDSLFLHADTLWYSSIQPGDFKQLQAYHQVKFYRTDMQGMCDSLVYSTKDSSILMYIEPVLWNEQNQLTAEEIQILFKNKSADRILLNRAAFIIAQQDTIHFNQISGKNMVGLIQRNKLHQILVDGNAQTIYFPADEKDIIGVNKAESSNLKIWIEDGKIAKLTFLTAPAGKTLPLDKSAKSDEQLKGFQWLDSFRPRNKYQLFYRERTQL
jgi:hypothetical protein